MSGLPASISGSENILFVVVSYVENIVWLNVQRVSREIKNASVRLFGSDLARNKDVGKPIRQPVVVKNRSNAYIPIR